MIAAEWAAAVAEKMNKQLKCPHGVIFLDKCPRCKGPIPCAEHEGKYPGALSRRDNKTEICSACGMAEALEDFGLAPKYDGKIYWKETE